MRHRAAVRGFILAAVLLAASFPPTLAQEAAPAKADGVVILDTMGSWRLFHALKPPVIESLQGLKPVTLEPNWLQWTTPEPPANWTGADFDDSTWLRGPALAACRTPYLARLCLRGKFTVTDPAQVQGLRVSVCYHGGAVVTVNGQPVARGNLPEAAPGGGLLAEPYPEDVYVTAAGKKLYWDRRHVMPGGDEGRRLMLRRRTLEDITIPGKLLRKGVNVIAIEILRAPYDKIVEKFPDTTKRRPPDELWWNTCQLWWVQLKASGVAGLVSEAVRPAGLQVWNSGVLTSDFDMDFGSRAEAVRPITLVGARNGTFSGKVVVGSAAPIRGLDARMSDLKCGDATVPASAVRVRYALPWGTEQGAGGLPHARHPRGTSLLGALAESPLEEFPVAEKQPSRGQDLETPGMPEPVFGAVVPVWVTVTVPRAARPGEYSGRLTIRAAGEEAVHVTVQLKVVDCTLPDAKDYTTWVELIESPDTVAVEYDLDMWSDEHFRRMGKAMEFMAEVGSRIVYVPLICQTNFGNAETMVRWLPEGEDKFRHDFTVMEKYLDTVEQHMGKPDKVVFFAWDLYIGAKSKTGGQGGEARAIAHLKSRGVKLGEGPLVSVVDPKTGKAETTELPPYADPESKVLWSPLFSELAQRMKRRGWDDRMMLGVVSDARPTKAEVQFLAEMMPDVPWVGHSHHGFKHRPDFRLQGIADVGYETRVWHVYFSSDLEQRRYGWRNAELVAEYNRARDLIEFTPSKWRHCAELNITGGQRGVGRIGADYWDAVKDARGRRAGTVSTRYPQSSWRNLDLYTALLAPGPDGPVATTRFEVFREGVQECEARIAIERALTDEALAARLGPDLANRCKDALDERTLYMWTSQTNLQLTGPEYLYATCWRTRAGVAGHYWFVGSGWQARSEKLYALAGEVTRALGNK